MASAESQHDELRELAASYVVGALTPAERDTFERHVASCADCAAELATLRPVADLLAQAAPQHNPPFELRARVLAAAAPQSTTRPSTRPAASTPTPSLAPWLLAAAALALAVGIGIYAAQLRLRVDEIDARLRATTDSAASTTRELAE